MESIEEAWKRLGSQLGWNWTDSEPSTKRRRNAEKRRVRRLALASFRVGWEAGCGWDDDPDAENSEVDMDTLLVGEGRIAAL